LGVPHRRNSLYSDKPRLTFGSSTYTHAINLRPYTDRLLLRYSFAILPLSPALLKYLHRIFSVNQTPISVLNVCLPDVTMPAASVDCVYNFAYTPIVTFGGILKPAFSARLIRPYLRYQLARINVNISAVAPLLYRMTSEVFDIHCDASHFLTPLIPSPSSAMFIVSLFDIISKRALPSIICGVCALFIRSHTYSSLTAHLIPVSAKHSLILRLAISKYPSSISIPVKSRLVFTQATPVLPLPIVKSTTRSPSFEYVLIKSSRSRTGFCVG